MPENIADLPEFAWLDETPLSAGASVSAFAWMATDLADVRQPAKIRGSDRVLPDAPGVAVTRRRMDQTRRLIPMLFSGGTDSEGEPGALPIDEQVWVNFYEFVELVVDPPAGDPRRELSVFHGSLTWGGDIVVEDWEYNVRNDGELVGVLDVSIPDGRLILGAS
jgi:hypothetical protein